MGPPGPPVTTAHTPCMATTSSHFNCLLVSRLSHENVSSLREGKVSSSRFIECPHVQGTLPDVGETEMNKKSL